MSTALAEIRDAARPAVLALPNGAPAVIDAMEQLKSIRTFIKNQLVEGVDFGPIPGTGKGDGERGPRKVMLQPGAQKVAMFLNVRPEYAIVPAEMGGGHVEYVVTTTLISRATDRPIGSGVGSATTMESKHRYRNAQRTCPACGEPSIIQTKKGRNPGGYWCVPDKGGCGANFNAGDRAVEGQPRGRVENDNIYDQRNTVLKMAKKRSYVDACIGLACLADEFTQDIDDTYDLGEERHHAAPQPPAAAPEKPEPRRRSARDEAKAEVDEAFRPAQASAPKEPAPKSGGKAKPTREEYLAASEDFDDLVVRATNALRKICPGTAPAEAKGRVMNGTIALLIEQQQNGHLAFEFEPSTVHKTNGQGKRVRDVAACWDCLKWLFEAQRAWLLGAVGAYLEGESETAREQAAAN